MGKRVFTLPRKIKRELPGYKVVKYVRGVGWRNLIGITAIERKDAQKLRRKYVRAFGFKASQVKVVPTNWRGKR